MTAPLAQPLLTLAEAPPGGITSRALLSGKAGSLTFFAFDAGQAIQEHTAPFDATLQVLEGSLEVRVGTSPRRVAAGEILTLPASVPHALRAPVRAKALLTMIRNPKEAAP